MTAIFSRSGRLFAALFAVIVLAVTGFGAGTAVAADSHHGGSSYSSYSSHDNRGYDRGYDSGRGYDHGYGNYGWGSNHDHDHGYGNW